MSSIYRASLASLIAVNATGVAFPLGLVQNLRLEKRYAVEGVPEIGSFRWAEILLHGYNAQFAWGRAYSKGIDLIGQGLVPADATIGSFSPFLIRVIDQEAQRLIAVIQEAVAEVFDVTLEARSKLMQNASGLAITMLGESELNG